jgi:hypothetical protein
VDGTAVECATGDGTVVNGTTVYGASAVDRAATADDGVVWEQAVAAMIRGDSELTVSISEW